jgi:hypothetical protein
MTFTPCLLFLLLSVIGRSSGHDWFREVKPERQWNYVEDQDQGRKELRNDFELSASDLIALY